MTTPAANNQGLYLLLIHLQSLVEMASRMAHDDELSGFARFADRVGGSLVAMLPIRHVIVCDSAVPGCMLVGFAMFILCR